MSQKLKPGDRVRCVNARCGDPVKDGRLTYGGVYTVSAVHDDWSVYLKEMPAIQFNASRFELAPRP